jgi:hypothetical protein
MVYRPGRCYVDGMPYTDRDPKPAQDLARGLADASIGTRELGHALRPESSTAARFHAASRLLNADTDPLLSRLAALTKGLPVRILIAGGAVTVEKL